MDWPSPMIDFINDCPSFLKSEGRFICHKNWFVIVWEWIHFIQRISSFLHKTLKCLIIDALFHSLALNLLNPNPPSFLGTHTEDHETLTPVDLNSTPENSSENTLYFLQHLMRKNENRDSRLGCWKAQNLSTVTYLRRIKACFTITELSSTFCLWRPSNQNISTLWRWKAYQDILLEDLWNIQNGPQNLFSVKENFSKPAVLLRLGCKPSNGPKVCSSLFVMLVWFYTSLDYIANLCQV